MVVIPNHVRGIIAVHEPVGAPLVGAPTGGNPVRATLVVARLFLRPKPETVDDASIA